MKRNLIETIMGGVVLAVAGFFLLFAYSHADLNEVRGYEISAQFASIGGIENGADVKINGVKVGTVIHQGLDPISYNAFVTMSVAPNIRLPADTQASVASEGLLGGKYINLKPGTASDILNAGARITRTEDYKSIEEMVGQLIFLATEPAGAPAKNASPALDDGLSLP